MGGRNRYRYMGEDGFNPPNDDCPDCEAPSKTYFMGGKTILRDDTPVAIYRYRCEHGHEWRTEEAPTDD